MVWANGQRVKDCYNKEWNGTKSFANAISDGLILQDHDIRWLWSISEIITGIWKFSYSEKNIPEHHFVHQKFYMDYHGLEPLPLLWAVGYWLFVSCIFSLVR
jgi:hypothetical protein